ncbi:MAG TPA: kinase [Dehalococcoidia bacterium]|nr:kinase [Dehalococcoidia bacterium]
MPPRRRAAAGRVDASPLPAHVTALLAPDALGPGEGRAELVQTHGSYVLLGATRVCKLKKPLDFGFLDYTTPAQRRRACEAELQLNRRLTSDVYLRIAAVVKAPGGFALAGAGDADAAADYAVLMRRLPQAGMLDRLVERDALSSALIARLAERLARFYRQADRGAAIDDGARPAMLLTNWQENFAQTLPYVDRTLTAAQYRRIAAAAYADLLRLRPLWRQRIAEGRARDGHGDLRLSAVCVEGETIQIYDCIEFNERFRHADVAADIAFLAMDLDAHGRPDLADEFVAAFMAASGDTTLGAVLPFYLCYRAYVRGKVYSFQLDEREVPPAQRRRAALTARARFRLAAGYARRARPSVTLVSGDEGPLRAAVAAALASRRGAVPIEAADVTSAADQAAHWLRQGIGAVLGGPPELHELAGCLPPRTPFAMYVLGTGAMPAGARRLAETGSVRAALGALHGLPRAARG